MCNRALETQWAWVDAASTPGNGKGNGDGEIGASLMLPDASCPNNALIWGDEHGEALGLETLMNERPPCYDEWNGFLFHRWSCIVSDTLHSINEFISISRIYWWLFGKVVPIGCLIWLCGLKLWERMKYNLSRIPAGLVSVVKNVFAIYIWIWSQWSQELQYILGRKWTII